MLSNSRIEELVRYTRSRYPARLYLPLALFLCTASLSAGWPATASDFAINVLLACTLLFQFRLWDDLSDVARDRIEHPERVLPQAASLVHFRILLAAAFTLNLGLLALLKPAPLIVVFLVLNATFLIWYGNLSKLCSSAVVGYHVVLIKYPVFVYLLSPGSADFDAQLPVVALVYLCFCVDEVLHDPRLHAVRGAFALLALEIAALVAVATFTVFDLNKLCRPAAIQTALAVLGTAVLAFLLRRHIPHTRNHQREKGNVS